ncbi:ODV-E66 [Crangon crangon nudivirus]|uniref:ODV-E66 n=1 Tax=Crangon crangon nudivirus TaxID=2880838 RepID=A0AAE9BYM4_9VIRU|nr:ODV-E66 [Crangon crangon nudivirus]UBZ25514.1 ODV-E66 [Crangon crangon nudivirus]
MESFNPGLNINTTHTNTHKHAIRTVDGPIFNIGLVVCIVLICLFIILTTYPAMEMTAPGMTNTFFVYKSVQYEEPDFTDYDFETQGRKKYNWDVDDDGMGRICEFFIKSMGYYLRSNRADRKVGLQALEDWLVAIIAQFETCPFWDDPEYGGSIDRLPWGKNWYSFTIRVPRIMCYYMVLKWHKIAISALCAKAIKRLILDPEHSLGWQRDKANSAMMLFPWAMAYNFTGDLDRTHPSYIYAVDQYDIRPDTTIANNEDGVHIDWAYLVHNGVYAYGYMESILDFYYDTKQVVPDVANFKVEEYMDEIHARLMHPTIPVSGGTLYTRTLSLSTITNGGIGVYKGKQKLHPVQVIPTMKYIRYFTDEWQWSMRGCQADVCWYESDQHVNTMGLYGVFDRKVYYKDSYSEEPVFPALGFYTKLGVTELPPVEHTEATTQPHFPKVIDTSHSYVFTDHETYAILRTQDISIELIEGIYAECVVLDIKAKMATIYVWVKEASKNAICLDGETMMPFTKGDCKYTIDFTNRTISYVPAMGFWPSISTMTGGIWDVYEIDNAGAGIPLKNGQPYCYTPNSLEIMTYDVFERMWKDKPVKFKYDAVSNQFLAYNP